MHRYAVRAVVLALALAASGALAQQPRIDSVSPAEGPIAGGTVISITGANLSGATVALDRAAVVPLSQSETEVRLRMPQHDNGYVVVSAANPSGTAYGEFLYVPPRLEELPPGYITTVAGVGNYVRTFGPANRASVFPNGISFDSSGSGSFCGDGGPAIDACLNTPYGIAVAPDGSIFVSENWNRLRRIDPAGIVTTFAGAGGLSKIVWGAGGFLYGCSFNRPGRYDAGGAYTGIAGTGVAGFSGDGGPALQARTNAGGQASGVAVDADGNFFFVDAANRRVRAVRFGAVLAPDGATSTVTADGQAVRASVLDRNGRPAANVRVEFTVPASGPSCLLSTAFAITGEDGVATVSCTPNCHAGSYSLKAQPLTAPAAASVRLTNPGEPCRRRALRR